MYDFWFDYGFRSTPAGGLFRNKLADPLYLCDEFGQIFAWPDDVVLVVA